MRRSRYFLRRKVISPEKVAVFAVLSVEMGLYRIYTGGTGGVLLTRFTLDLGRVHGWRGKRKSTSEKSEVPLYFVAGRRIELRTS